MSEEKTGDNIRKTRSFSYLQTDLMYYCAARRCLSLAKSLQPKVHQELEEHKKLCDREQALRGYLNHYYLPDEYGESADDESTDTPQEDLESICIALESQDYAIGLAYAPILENLAVTHLLCAAALEAHINQHGAANLSGREFQDFDKISITGKWQFLPRILGLKGFDPGAEPFQGFDQLIRFRNLLIHYRHRREEWQQQPVPTFLEELGLTIPQAERSVKATRAMIGELAKQLQVNEVDCLAWDVEADLSYFGIQFDKVPKRPIKPG